MNSRSASVLSRGGAAAGRGSSRGGARRGAVVGRGGAQRDTGAGRGDLDREIERSFREQDRLQWRQSALLWDRELERQRRARVPVVDP